MNQPKETPVNPIIVGPQYKFDVACEGPLIGFSLEAKRTTRDGEQIKVCRRAFLTDNDGDFFYACLDQISKIFLREWIIRERANESSISNCLILISTEDSARIYINIPTIMNIIARKRINAGDPITREDIADIREIVFIEPELKEASYLGVIYIFSIGWRRGLYYDFTSIAKGRSTPISINNIKNLLASFYAHMIFPEIHRLYPEIKEELIKNGWFPFIRISGKNFELLCGAIKHKYPLAEVSLEIIDSFDGQYLNDMLNAWMNKDHFKNHEAIIRKVIDEFLEGDYISSIHILYPRIEGLMRHIYLGEEAKANSSNLAKKLTSIGKKKTNEFGLFFPEDFNEYLQTFYFSSFDLEKGDVNLSRHSLAHGVAKESDFNKIKAFQAILIMDQISFYI